MRHSKWIPALLIIAGVGLSGCTRSSQAAGGPAEGKPAVVEAVAGSEVKRVTLTQRASERLAIETVPVGEIAAVPAKKGVPATPAKKVVPYIAVFYDAKGGSWVYTVTQPLTFLRQRVVIERVTGSDAVLSDGPAVGTAVVTKGVSELYGAETGVGK
jgi:hypothetical protein